MIGHILFPTEWENPVDRLPPDIRHEVDEMILYSGMTHHEIANYLWGQCCFVKKSDVAKYVARRSRRLYHNQDKSGRRNRLKLIAGMAVVQEQGGLCPLCGQPTRTSNVVNLLALSQLVKLLDEIRAPKEAGG